MTSSDQLPVPLRAASGPTVPSFSILCGPLAKEQGSFFTISINCKVSSVLINCWDFYTAYQYCYEFMALLTISSNLLFVSFAIATSCSVNGCVYVCVKSLLWRNGQKRRPNFTADDSEALIGGVEKHSKVKYCCQQSCQITALRNTLTR